MEINYVELGKRIKHFREERNKTQDDLRAALNISKMYMGRIESGSAKVTLPLFVRIANALCVSPDELLNRPVEYSRAVVYKEFEAILSDCTDYERKVLVKEITLLVKHKRGREE